MGLGAERVSRADDEYAYFTVACHSISFVARRMPPHRKRQAVDAIANKLH